MFIDTATAKSRSSKPRIIISPRTSPYHEQSITLLETSIGQDAPSSYLEATTPGLYSSRLSDDQGARLLASEGSREAKDATLKEEKYRRTSVRDRCSRLTWLKWVAAVVAILSLVAVLAVMIAAVTVRSDRQSTMTAGYRPASSLAQPSKADEASHPEGFIGGGAERPKLVATLAPTLSSAASKQVFPIRWPSRCGKEYNVKTEDYDFGTPKELYVQEAVHQLDGPYKSVSGWIHVARAPADQTPGTIRARLSYAVSSSVNVNSVKHTSTATGIVIGDPSFPDGFDGMRPGTACLGLSLVLYMATGATLETFNVASTHMGMQVHRGVEFSVTNSTSISLTTGTLDAAALNSRRTYLETISGSISGKYSLNDLVAVNTKSGSVNINIEPKAAADRSAEPAVFVVDYLSGSVRVDFERNHIPEREYQTYINTTVGSIDGTFIHGSRTEINSVAGFVNADLLPFKSGDYPSTIKTRTHSGQTSLTVRSPYKARNIPWTGLTSVHRSTSGSLDVRYPQEWSGRVNGTSLSGGLHLQGKDLELLKEVNEPGNSHVEVKNGDGASRMEIDTVSGSCAIRIGKLAPE